MKNSLPLGRSLACSLPGLLVLLGVVPAQAKETGQNFACVNCHEGQDKPEVVATFAAPRVEPGQAVGLTVTTTHDTASVGGVLVDSFGVGSFEIVDPAETHFFEDVTTQVTHAVPKAFTEGQMEFTFSWVAPDTVGPVEFDVWANAANGDLDPHSDSATGITAHVAVGCDALWYYLDADGDGFGEEGTEVFSCDPIPDRINQGGDCDDENPDANSGATEVCNEIDDNCDGEVDEGFEKQVYAEDMDGDGFGGPSGETYIGCRARPGFGIGFDDCNDSNPNVHPEAIEVINGIDDNCDGQRDEVVVGSGGAGATPPSGGSSGMLASGGMPAAAGGSPAVPPGGTASSAVPGPAVPGDTPPGATGAPAPSMTVAPGPGSSPGDDASCAVRKPSLDSSTGAPLFIAALALLAHRRRARRDEPAA